MITQNYLKKVLHYNPDTGIFTRNIVKGGKLVGTEAGSINHMGYRQIKIKNVLYQAHRLVFLYIDGYLQETTVDHINRNRADNRYCNLRETSKKCQARNCGISKNNTSGVKGISWLKRNKKWSVTIGNGFKFRYLGIFDDFLEACYHRYAAEQCLGFQNSSALQYINRFKTRFHQL